MAAIEKFVRIFATTVPAFLPREKPISRNAKPACMNITRQAATITQIELMPTLWGRPLASKVSARAAAGRTSATSPAMGTARASFLYVIESRPPRVSGAPRRIGAGGLTHIGPVSKDRHDGFRHSVERPWTRCESSMQRFVHRDKVAAPPRG